MLSPLSWRYWWGLEKTECNCSDPASCKRIISGLYTFTRIRTQLKLSCRFFNFFLDLCLIFYFSLSLKYQLFSPENINNLSSWTLSTNMNGFLGGELCLEIISDFPLVLSMWGPWVSLKFPKNSLTDILRWVPKHYPCF